MLMKPLIPLNDGIKLTLVDRCAQIIRASGWEFYVSTIHLGVIFGQLCQAQYSPEHAVELVVAQCEAWRDNREAPEEIRRLPHISDEDVLKLRDEARARIPESDQGGLLDLGCQLGQWIVAGASRERAFHEVGEWIIKWYAGENPWKLGTPNIPVGESAWHGLLRIADGQSAFVDETGAHKLPVLCHFMEAFSAYTRDRDRVRHQLDKIKEAGYDGIRFLDHLGYYSGAWGGKEVTPWSFTNREGGRVNPTPDYYGQLRDFLSDVKSRGLKVHHDRGDLGASRNVIPFGDIKAHSERVCSLYDELGWDMVALYAGNNEDWQNGNLEPARLREVVASAKSRGAITALSCPPDCSEDAPEVHAYSADVFYTHGWRSGEPTDRLRHIFSLAYEGYGHLMDAGKNPRRLGWQGEPTGPNEFPGPGVTVNNVNDVEELGLLAFQSLMCRQAWVYMSQYGVFFNGWIHEHSGFWVVPQMRGLLQQFAADVMSWNKLYHGGRGEAVLKSPTGYVDGNHGAAEGPARIDQVISPDGRKCVATVHGGRGRKQVRLDMGGRLRLTILAPRKEDGREDVHVHTAEINSGDTITLEYRVGRALLVERI